MVRILTFLAEATYGCETNEPTEVSVLFLASIQAPNISRQTSASASSIAPMPGCFLHMIKSG